MPRLAIQSGLPARRCIACDMAARSPYRTATSRLPPTRIPRPLAIAARLTACLEPLRRAAASSIEIRCDGLRLTTAGSVPAAILATRSRSLRRTATSRSSIIWIPSPLALILRWAVECDVPRISAASPMERYTCIVPTLVVVLPLSDYGTPAVSGKLFTRSACCNLGEQPSSLREQPHDVSGERARCPSPARLPCRPRPMLDAGEVVLSQRQHIP